MSEKIALIFPGQGSQKVGMGLPLCESIPLAKDTFDEADEILGRSISDICFEGPLQELTKTENAQLAIFTNSVANFRVAQTRGIIPTAVAGHSLGEYSALVAAGVISFSDGLRLVEQRSSLMSIAEKEEPGMMAAILGLDNAEVEEICRTVSISSGQIAQVANYNCPGQLIVSGSVSGVQDVVKKAKLSGAKRALPLKVSGAFHSNLMEPARVEFSKRVGDFHFSDPQVGLVVNVTGDWAKTGKQIQQLLVEQITKPVLWESCMQTLYSHGINSFVEVGDSNVLAGLVTRTLNNTTCTNISTFLN